MRYFVCRFSNNQPNVTKLEKWSTNKLTLMTAANGLHAGHKNKFVMSDLHDYCSSVL